VLPIDTGRAGSCGFTIQTGVVAGADRIAGCGGTVAGLPDGLLGVADQTGVPTGTPVGGNSGSSVFGGATAGAPESGGLSDGESKDEFNSGGVSGRGAMSEVAGG
jgi:hypothetical protein